MGHFAVSSVGNHAVEESIIPVLLNRVEEVSPSPEVNGVVEVNTKKYSGVGRV